MLCELLITAEWERRSQLCVRISKDVCVCVCVCVSSLLEDTYMFTSILNI